MAWRIIEALRQRGYTNSHERAAYRRGYCKGFYSNQDELKIREQNIAWPNAYAAGFWDGRNDKDGPQS
jgi:hypothetical protein